MIACKRLNKKLIFADVIPNDWKKQGKEKVVEAVLRKVKPGSIINLHDYLEGIGRNEDIVLITKQILDKLSEKYSFVTVSKILN